MIGREVLNARHPGAKSHAHYDIFGRGRVKTIMSDQPGGYAGEADMGDTYVQQPNGPIRDRGNRPEPGAVIVVPTKKRREGVNLAVLFGGNAQILSAVTTIVVVLREVGIWGWRAIFARRERMHGTWMRG